MKRFFHILLGSLPLFLGGAPQLPETVAVFGDVKLKKELFQRIPLPSDPTEWRKALKKLVDTEIYITVIRQLLERSAIVPDHNTASRYVAFRKAQCGGAFSPEFEKKLRAQITNSDFQLRAALFFTFHAADPAIVDPDMESINKHYDLNKEKFRTAVKSSFGIFRAGTNDDEGRKNAAVILSRLRQGEEFDALAKKFDPSGSVRNTAARHRETFAQAVKTVKTGETIAVPTDSGIYMIKVTARGKDRQIPLHEATPFIREMLSGLMLKNALEQYILEILAKTQVKYCF